MSSSCQVVQSNGMTRWEKASSLRRNSHQQDTHTSVKPHACDPFVSIPFSETSVQTSGIRLYFPLVIWSFSDTWVLCSEKGGYPLRLNVGRERKGKKSSGILSGIGHTGVLLSVEKSQLFSSQRSKTNDLSQTEALYQDEGTVPSDLIQPDCETMRMLPTRWKEWLLGSSSRQRGCTQQSRWRWGPQGPDKWVYHIEFSSGRSPPRSWTVQNQWSKIMNKTNEIQTSYPSSQETRKLDYRSHRHPSLLTQNAKSRVFAK